MIRVLVVTLGVLIGVTAHGCVPNRTTHGNRWEATILTFDGRDHYRISSGTTGTITASAPASNTSTNLRLAGVSSPTTPTRDQQACATWVGEASGIVQPGVVLRLRTDGDRVRAIMITNSVLFHYRGKFHVHLLDSDAAQPLTRVASIDAPWAVAPLPWRICARVKGRSLAFKAWPTAEAEPAWGDATHAGSTLLPPEWVFSGAPGWYAGHLAAGEHLTYRDLTAGPLPS